MKRPGLVLALLLAAGLGLAAGTCETTGGEERPLHIFSKLAGTEDVPPAFAGEAWVVRYVAVEPAEHLFDADHPVVGDTLAASLFGEEKLVGVVDAVQTVMGHRNVRGHVIEPAPGEILLSIGDGRLTGWIALNGDQHRMYLRYDAQTRRHYLVEADPTLEDHVPEAPPPETP